MVIICSLLILPSLSIAIDNMNHFRYYVVWKEHMAFLISSVSSHAHKELSITGENPCWQISLQFITTNLRWAFRPGWPSQALLWDPAKVKPLSSDCDYFTSLFCSNPQHTCLAPTLPLILCPPCFQKIIRPHVALKEKKELHTKLSPPYHQNSSHSVPWLIPLSLLSCFWGKGICPIKGHDSPYSRSPSLLTASSWAEFLLLCYISSITV
jgi:hypothetical protein